MINREFTHILQQKLRKGKVILLVGPRQVGKTTLINELLKDKNYLFLNGDDTSGEQTTLRQRFQNSFPTTYATLHEFQSIL